MRCSGQLVGLTGSMGEDSRQKLRSSGIYMILRGCRRIEKNGENGEALRCMMN